MRPMAMPPLAAARGGIWVMAQRLQVWLALHRRCAWGPLASETGNLLLAKAFAIDFRKLTIMPVSIVRLLRSPVCADQHCDGCFRNGWIARFKPSERELHRTCAVLTRDPQARRVCDVPRPPSRSADTLDQCDCRRAPTHAWTNGGLFR
jgi:hypothetical protein